MQYSSFIIMKRFSLCLQWSVSIIFLSVFNISDKIFLVSLAILSISPFCKRLKYFVS